MSSWTWIKTEAARPVQGWESPERASACCLSGSVGDPLKLWRSCLPLNVSHRQIHSNMTYMGVEPKIMVPQIIHFNRVFHYEPSILGYPYFWKHPYTNWYFFFWLTEWLIKLLIERILVTDKEFVWSMFQNSRMFSHDSVEFHFFFVQGCLEESSWCPIPNRKNINWNGELLRSSRGKHTKKTVVFHLWKKKYLEKWAPTPSKFGMQQKTHGNSANFFRGHQIHTSLPPTKRGPWSLHPRTMSLISESFTPEDHSR